MSAARRFSSVTAFDGYVRELRQLGVGVNFIAPSVVVVSFSK